ncbi:MAG: phospholipase D-like domain-containing protein, partial [Casimicrobiaceae bacterium]
MTLPATGIDAPQVALQRAFTRAAGSQVYHGNHLDLLIDGAMAYPAMLEQIDHARRRIHLENYIFQDDACGHEFAAHLIARAKDGVTVRVLYDWVGSFATGRRFWHTMRAAGIDVRGFGPFSIVDPLLIFARDHRKLLVVDGECAVTG